MVEQTVDWMVVLMVGWMVSKMVDPSDKKKA